MNERFKRLRTTGRAAIVVSASSCPRRLLLNIGIVKMTESSGQMLADGSFQIAGSDHNTISPESIGVFPPRLF